MRKKSTKTSRLVYNAEPAQPPFKVSKKSLTSWGDHSIDDDVYFNVSLVAKKYNVGKIKEFIQLPDDSIVCIVWDIDHGMWRTLPVDSLLESKPPRKRRSSKTIESTDG